MRFIFRALMMLLVLAAVLAGAGWWWLNQPLPLAQPTLELEVEPGTTPRGVAREVRGCCTPGSASRGRTGRSRPATMS